MTSEQRKRQAFLREGWVFSHVRHQGGGYRHEDFPGWRIGGSHQAGGWHVAGPPGTAARYVGDTQGVYERFPTMTKACMWVYANVKPV